jgi:hypothetical protein
MNTLSIDLTQPDVLAGPACKTCLGQTRLTGVEPHPTKTNTDLRTYQCVVCDAVRAVVVPIAH